MKLDSRNNFAPGNTGSQLSWMTENHAIFSARSPDRPKHLRRGIHEKYPIIWRNGVQYNIMPDGKLRPVRS
jgi:hypothetical protein